MKPTRRFVLLIEKIFPYRFLAAKITKIPLMKMIIDKMLFDKTNLTVLPKDTIIEIKPNKIIKPPVNIILPSRVVEYFIRKTNYRFIMNFCICREAMNCQNHSIELGCLFLGETARKINPTFGREATIEEALMHTQRCRDEGLIHLIGRDKIDETWLGIGPGEKLLTICNCCSCCCLWKVLPNLNYEISAKIKRMPGLEIKVTEKCIGCGICKEQCFVQAIMIQNNKAIIDDNCKGCGRCADCCPHKAIQVVINDGQFIEKTIERVESSVNVS